MSAFEKLHPSIQHHIVNSLEWKSLRALQEQAIDPVLAGINCLLLAPTAGGKTEAAILPILSRMLSEDWRGLSVLYVCPIRALLNNLEHRISFYAGLVGRTCGLWHGDVAQATKSKTLAQPPDILLTTPESLEALLISTRTDRFFFFGSVQVIVVDEIHAFAGDDRGWHLLAVLERIGKITKHDIQRIGLSATVGNPGELLRWLVIDSNRKSMVVAPKASVPSDANVMIDFVGNMENAAKVLKTLYRGEKRLVFCDSRTRTEELASLLRSSGVNTFVSHSSLSVEQRRDAEAAFREARDCVIVATSTLELGIDVGDLDRVIQLDAPGSVASFLQRLGRTGRRTGAQRNCLVLATSRGTLLQAAALVMLWREGHVEPLAPPPKPIHVVAQQLMALILQQGGIGRGEWREWLGDLLAAMQLSEQDVRDLLEHMLSLQILSADGEILGIGPDGERRYGSKNFMSLLSVFDTPPFYRVFAGAQDLGNVHPLSFKRSDGEPAILSLGGRAWQVIHIDFKHKTVQVIPSEKIGRSRWLGESRPLSYEYCQAIRRVLLGGGPKDILSKRAEAEIAQVIEESNCVIQGGLVVEVDREKDRAVWWTFAGLLANSQLAGAFASLASCGNRQDNLAVTIGKAALPLEFRKHLDAESTDLQPGILSEEEPVKFWECIPPQLLSQMQISRFKDQGAVDATLSARLTFREMCFNS